MMKTFIQGLLILSFLILISSCSATRKAKRKYRKAERLMTEAGMLAPQLADTIFIEKIDTVVLNKDSIIFQTNLLLDTVKVDNIIEKLILVKQEGGDVRALRKEIYDELLPDLHYNSRDSLKITIDSEEHFVRFDANIVIENDRLIVTVKPVDNVPFVSITKEINIDARKMGRWWAGFKWGIIASFAVAILLWFLRGTIGTYLNKF